MSSKSGRLTFSGRQEYEVVTVYSESRRDSAVIGYGAICPCALGYHYLAIDRETGAVVERTDTGQGKGYRWPTYAKALAAIEAWQRQHAAAQATSDETPAE